MKKSIINFFSNILYNVFKFFKIKIFKLNVGRIGHLVELYFLYSLQLKKEKNFFFCYLYCENNVSNKYLFDKFKKDLNIIPFTIGNFFDRLINVSLLPQKKKNTIKLFDFNNKKSGWEFYDGEILNLQIKKSEQSYFDDFMHRHNLKYPYVCINLWSFKHLKEYYPNEDMSHHKLRFSNEEVYFKLIDHITEKGMNVVIMGHDASRFENLKNKNIFNYSKVREDIIDFFLIKNCHCYISDCTGLDYLAFALKKPMLLNSPYLNYFFNKQKNVFYILKNQFSLKDKKILSLNEMFYDYDTMFKVKSEFYFKNNITLQDNTPLQILDAYKQLDSLIKNNFCEARIENYSKKFWSEYEKFLTEKNHKEKNHYKSGPFPSIYDNIKITN